MLGLMRPRLGLAAWRWVLRTVRAALGYGLGLSYAVCIDHSIEQLLLCFQVRRSFGMSVDDVEFEEVQEVEDDAWKTRW